MADADKLVSDDDREAAVLSLREHLMAGRLTVDEFGERVDMAYGARGADQLARAHAGLEHTEVRASEPRRKAVWLTVALLSHVVKRGRMRLGRCALTASVLSDVDLDLRSVEVTSRRSVLPVLVLFGNVDLYVSESVDVSVHGLTVFGHHRDWGHDLAHANGPRVRVLVVSLFGAVDVWRVPARMKGDYSKLIDKLRRAQKQLRE